MVHHPLVEVLSPKMGVAIGRGDLKNSLFNGEDSDIEGAPSEIEDENVLLLGVVLRVCRKREGALITSYIT